MGQLQPALAPVMPGAALPRPVQRHNIPPGRLLEHRGTGPQHNIIGARNIQLVDRGVEDVVAAGDREMTVPARRLMKWRRSIDPKRLHAVTVAN